MTDVPAGWYDDPEDAAQFRYWDGSLWTDHRSPKSHAGGSGSGNDGAWNVVPESFRLLGRGWRELVVAALPLFLLTILAGALAVVALDGVFDPSISDIVDRFTQPGFDPVNDAADEAYIEGIEVSFGIGSAIGLGLAVLIYTIGTFVVSVTITVFLAALRSGRALSVAQSYAVALRRFPRILGIAILWALAMIGVLVALSIVVAVSVVITPLLLIVLIPALIGATIYLWPYGALAMTTLSLGPSDDPPLRRTIALIKPAWGAIALRLLVLTVVFAVVGFAVNLTTTPFSAASVWAGALATLLVSAAQTVLTAAGNVVLYDFASGPIDEEIGGRGLDAAQRS